MTRVASEEVLQIMNDVTLDKEIVEAYIIGANALVNDILGSGDTTVLREIERWLAAHMIACTRERMAKKEGADGAFIEYTGNYGQGLTSTPYGQVVRTLDTTGKMASLGLKSARIIAIPTR